MKDEENVKYLVKRQNDFSFNSKLNTERYGYEKAQVWLVEQTKKVTVQHNDKTDIHMKNEDKGPNLLFILANPQHDS